MGKKASFITSFLPRNKVFSYGFSNDKKYLKGKSAAQPLAFCGMITQK
jgi:hypothetical protein